MPHATAIPITPKVLAWAIDESGHDSGAVARAVQVDRDELEAWLAGRAQPTLSRFRKLADFLERPEALFLLPRPPQIRRPNVAFRGAPGEAEREASPAERLHVREAARLQRGISWIRQEFGEAPPHVPRRTTSENAERVAAAARQALGIPVAQQLGWESAFDAQRRWRAAIERAGIAVLFLPMGADAVRGFSLWEARAPLIAINTHWRAEARVFTLFHEYAHILTRTNSMCAQPHRPRAWDEGDRIERWCEGFAAAFLLPWPAVETLLANKFGWKGEPIKNLDRPSYVARKLHVSLRAAVLRLVDRGVSTWSLYQAIPPSWDGKRKGGPATGGRRRPQLRVDQYGARATRTFLDAVRKDLITRDDALRYLDVADSEIEELEALTTAGS